jgi:hypothetical protein
MGAPKAVTRKTNQARQHLKAVSHSGFRVRAFWVYVSRSNTYRTSARLVRSPRLTNDQARIATFAINIVKKTLFSGGRIFFDQF